MYCSNCKHPLNSLEAKQCSECGQPFDPQDISTFEKNRSRSARSALKACCLISAVFSGIVAIVLVVLTFIVPEQNYAVLIPSVAAILPVACIVAASRNIRFTSLVGSSAGLAWGFLFVWLVFVLVQNPSNVGLTTLPLVFALVPLLFLAISSPIWFLSRFVRSRQRGSLLANPIV